MRSGGAREQERSGDQNRERGSDRRKCGKTVATRKANGQDVEKRSGRWKARVINFKCVEI